MVLPVVTYVTKGTVADRETPLNSSNRGSTSLVPFAYLTNCIDGLKLKIICL